MNPDQTVYFGSGVHIVYKNILADERSRGQKRLAGKKLKRSIAPLHITTRIWLSTEAQ